MSWPVSIYVREDGVVYPASQTDQAGKSSTALRTYAGAPVEFAGTWWPSQFPYAPFRRACEDAATNACLRTSPLMRLAQCAENSEESSKLSEVSSTTR